MENCTSWVWRKKRPDGANILIYTDDSLGASFGLGYRFTKQLNARLHARIEQHDPSKID